MAAPVATARQTPTGRKLKNGHRVKITFARLPTLSIWEIESTPFTMEGGDAIDTTTAHNDVARTKWHRELIDYGQATIRCAYDPNVYAQLRNDPGIINYNDQVTFRWPEGSTLAVWGHAQSFTPDGLTEGGFPTANLVVVASNTDDSDAEQPPVYTNVSGT